MIYVVVHKSNLVIKLEQSKRDNETVMLKVFY